MIRFGKFLDKNVLNGVNTVWYRWPETAACTDVKKKTLIVSLSGVELGHGMYQNSLSNCKCMVS
jgi:hypothetical protein